MLVELGYDRDGVCLEIGEDNLAGVIRPWKSEGGGDNGEVLAEAVAGGGKEFCEKAAGMRVCVLLDDGTRDEPFGDIFSELFGLLKEANSVRFIICTGTHEADTEGNRRIVRQVEASARAAGLGEHSIHIHDCDWAKFVEGGVTSWGTKVIYNQLIDEADIFLVISDAKVHYFSGYSNPVKNFLPGVCAFETVEGNHRLALEESSTFGVHPWHSKADRRENPCAKDQLEGMEMIVGQREVYCLLMVSSSGKVQWAKFGQAEAVCRAGFDEIDRCNTHMAEPVSRLIVSPGGYPNDSSLYNSQRALELTKNVIVDGGEVLFLSGCRDGIGDAKTMENFYDRLIEPLDVVLKRISEDYLLYSHKPYKFAQLIQRLKNVWVYSELEDEVVEQAHMKVARDPQAVVDGWLAEDVGVRILAVDGANKIALYSK